LVSFNEGAISIKLLSEGLKRIQISTDKTASELAIKRLQQEKKDKSGRYEQIRSMFYIGCTYFPYLVRYISKDLSFSEKLSYGVNDYDRKVQQMNISDWNRVVIYYSSIKPTNDIKQLILEIKEMYTLPGEINEIQKQLIHHEEIVNKI